MTSSFGLTAQPLSRSPRNVTELILPGLRKSNPKRAHLWVSTVLGKHIPTTPFSTIEAGDALADLCLTSLKNSSQNLTGNYVFAFAETATGLGQIVARRTQSVAFLQSTRRNFTEVWAAFEEGHSHATTHFIAPTDTSVFAENFPLLLVDDEISTGATALDAIAALQKLCPREHYIVAALVDMRSPEDRIECDSAAATLGVTIEFISLAQGEAILPTTLIDDVAALPDYAWNPTVQHRGRAQRLEISWPSNVPDSGRFGFYNSDWIRYDTAISLAAQHIYTKIESTRPIIVLGHEEFMYTPMMIAKALETQTSAPVFHQTTTRSPAHVRNLADYPLRRGFRFRGPEPENSLHPTGETKHNFRYLYNAQLTENFASKNPESLSAQIIFIADAPADTPQLTAPEGIIETLTAAGEDVLVVIISGTDPVALKATRSQVPPPLVGPYFGSYAANEVGWLLKDLSQHHLEQSVETREQAIQQESAHYAESLPIEYQPDQQYQELFVDVLNRSATRLALAVGMLTELVLAERGPSAVLVSLARAGVPIGILMRRWAIQFHHTALPHYAVSIVRGKGIDTNALKSLAALHNSSDIVFVDGWTGKGAIARELTAAINTHNAVSNSPQFNSQLAVLADPGFCVSHYGTRDDFLIASACLNSTVSGLISRTILNNKYIGNDDYHGAKFYPEFAPNDQSETLLTAISDTFAEIHEGAVTAAIELHTADRAPTWSGWEVVTKLQKEYGISSANFIKPGVGETTRVLLRRLPWRILLREKGLPDLAHIELLAKTRGVPVEIIPDLPYLCVGLIKELS